MTAAVDIGVGSVRQTAADATTTAAHARPQQIVNSFCAACGVVGDDVVVVVASALKKNAGGGP